MTQTEALALLENGQSILLTGAAGTGKTYLLNKFIKRAKRQGKNVAITATTGLAATHLNGNTIHSWSGLGIRDSIDSGFHNKLSKQRRDLITKADILVIDEISMMHDFRLDMLDEVMRQVRGGGRPFGGVQIILCGDFFQLPPINRSDSRSGSFITNSKIWHEGAIDVCYLEEQFRQSEDTEYRDILNGIRAGQLTRSQLDALNKRKEAVADPFTPRTLLHTVNIDVDTINSQQLNSIDSKSYLYSMEVSGKKQYVESLLKSCLAPKTLELKRGAIVMCIKNSQDKKYVNGSLGKIEDFEPYTNYPVIKLNSGKEITVKPESWELIDGDKRRATITQLPLRLAWAITVHKSQGMTLDAAQIDLRKAFVEGMGYVALSRVKSLKNLILDGMNGMALRTSPLARQLDIELRQKSSHNLNKNKNIMMEWQNREDNNQNSSQHEMPKSSWSDKLEKMRQDFPNAYKPWHEAEDVKLIKLFENNSNIKTLSKMLGRHPGSIKSRLKKHFGEEIVLK